MKSTRRATTIGIAAATVLGGALALAPSASAGEMAMAQVRPAAATVKGAAPAVAARPAGTMAPYDGQCGSGYKIVNSAEIGVVGTVYLTYSSATGENCVW